MKWCFILNPISGKKSLDTDTIRQTILARFPHAQICLTQAPGHATQLAQTAAQEGFQAVVAMGGDGTINETARGLVGSQTALGVIPRGSGNGFARELGMPLAFKAALEKLLQTSPVPCDVGYANGELFLNLAGVGIEAAIAWQFMEHGKTGSRGKWPYFKIGAKTAFSYKPPELEVTINGQTCLTAPLTLVFANGRQYGSNFKIAPTASLTDGKLEMVSVQNAPKWKLALAVPAFFTDTWRPFGLIHTEQVQHALIKRAGEIMYHIDGEPRKATDSLEISISPKALHILLPRK